MKGDETQGNLGNWTVTLFLTGTRQPCFLDMLSSTELFILSTVLGRVDVQSPEWMGVTLVRDCFWP